MFEKSKLEAVQQTQVQPPILPSAGDAGTPHQVRAFPVTSGERRAALPPQTAASQTFAQTFGLDFRAATLTVLVDLMVFGGDAISLGVLIPLGVVVAAIL